jgi:pyridoxal 5'-phosphate synthase pdxT subunit
MSSFSRSADGEHPPLGVGAGVSDSVAEDPALIGVLALQGGFAAHERMLAGLGARTRQVRVPADLEGLDALVIPGGESTTMTLGVEREGLAGPLRDFAAAGRPVLGSCAGLIMLDREHLGLMEITARRNAFGRQVRSFESDVQLQGIDGPPMRGIFIRAPWISEPGPGVAILATVDGHPVAARQERLLAVAFHAELGQDDRLHRLFLELVGEARAAGPARVLPGA